MVTPVDERSEEQLEEQQTGVPGGNGAAAPDPQPEEAPSPESAAPESAEQPAPPSAEESAVEESAAEESPAGGEAPQAEVPEVDSAPEPPPEEYAATVRDDSAAAASESEPAAEESPAEEPVAEEPVGETADEAPAPRKRTDPSQVKPVEEVPEEELEEVEDLERDWYILKVQSNREKSIRDALERRVKGGGLERFFGEIIVPTEDVVEYKAGKRRITKRKLWPGYIVVNMAINDDTWFLVRETPGIGDFTGSIGKPTPMLPQEVERIIPKPPSDDEDEEAQLKTDIPFKQGDRVRVKDGYFQNFEGDVDSVDEANGRVTVMISVFGRSTPVELEHWHIENV